MTNNKNNVKELDCQLHCKSTASLTSAVLKDLSEGDRPLKDLLDEQLTSEDKQPNSN